MESTFITGRKIFLLDKMKGKESSKLMVTISNNLAIYFYFFDESISTDVSVLENRYITIIRKKYMENKTSVYFIMMYFLKIQ